MPKPLSLYLKALLQALNADIQPENVTLQAHLHKYCTVIFSVIFTAKREL